MEIDYNNDNEYNVKTNKILCKFSLSCGGNYNILSAISGYSSYIDIGIYSDNCIIPTVTKEDILNVFLGKLLNDLEKFPELVNYIKNNNNFKIHLHDEVNDMCQKWCNSINTSNEYVVWICDHEH